VETPEAGAVKSLRVLFASMLATAAVVPLVTYGITSVYTMRTGTRRTVVEGNANVARQVSEQVRRYISTNLKIFQAVAVDVEGTGLTVAQQDLILRNFGLRFPEFRELTLFDAQGRTVASSRVGPAFARPPTSDTKTVMGVVMTPVTIDDDLLPTTIVAMPLTEGTLDGGWLVGQFRIEELWRMVSRIRIGEQGVALVVGAGGVLLAHGDSNALSRVALGESFAEHPVVAKVLGQTSSDPVSADVRGADRVDRLSVGVRVPDLDWVVLIEQPYKEAFALARRQEKDLTASISLALLIMVIVGVSWARAFIRPIDVLVGATQTLAEGHLDERVRIKAIGEFDRLGRAFNSMADRLVQLQDDARKQERHAMFGRVAAGLVHDLSHPFKNVQNNCKLILKMHDDPEYRELFSRTVDREFSTIRRVFEDLRNIARPMPLEHFPLDLTKLVGEVTEAMRANADYAGLVLESRLSLDEVWVAGDMFAIGRVCRNLIMNAFEATPPQGHVVVETSASDGRARIVVADTGCGIPSERLATMFEDFSTTKRQGLGLGLAITKKIVDQLGGTIAADSTVGTGTTFTVEFPRVPKPERSADVLPSGPNA
jgi:signal transduction histidine kinase